MAYLLSFILCNGCFYQYILMYHWCRHWIYKTKMYFSLIRDNFIAAVMSACIIWRRCIMCKCCSLLLNRCSNAWQLEDISFIAMFAAINYASCCFNFAAINVNRKKYNLSLQLIPYFGYHFWYIELLLTKFKSIYHFGCGY